MADRLILAAFAMVFALSGVSHGETPGTPLSGSIVGWGSYVVGGDMTRGFTAVAAGSSHSLGLKEDGSIVVWGYNNHGQCNVPEPNTGFKAVAAGLGVSLGLREDGSIVAWGDNRTGQCSVPEPNRGFVAMAAGAGFSVAVRAQDAARIVSPTRSGTLVQGDALRFSGSPSDIAGAAYLWDFGDGRNSVIRNPGLLSFPETGEFIVSYGSVTDGQAPDWPGYTVISRARPARPITAAKCPGQR